MPQNMEQVKPAALNQEEAEKLERIAFILKTVAHPLRLGVKALLRGLTHPFARPAERFENVELRHTPAHLS